MAFKIGSYTVINDNREMMGFRNVLHCGYLICGYRNSILTNYINRADYGTDSTSKISATASHVANYLSGGSGTAKGIAWGVGASGTSHAATDSGVNFLRYGDETVTTGTMSGGDARVYHESVTYEGIAAYTTGGGSAKTDKYTFSTDALSTTTVCPSVLVDHVAAYTGNRQHGFWQYSGTTGRALVFSNDSWTTSSGMLNISSYTQALAISTRENKAYHVGSWYAGDDNSFKALIAGTTITTTSIGECPSRIKGLHGNSESNCFMGNNYGRALGGYSGTGPEQHNMSSKISHMTDTYVDCPALDVPNAGSANDSGDYGASSAATCWR
tara:strand:- start:2030 stop:3010 length:981 start_codon:yes stop_codon:yes gene_type:complete